MHILIFTGGDFPKNESVLGFLDRLPKVDFIIVADSGLESLDIYNSTFGKKFYPNLILGDMDSLSDKSLLEKYCNAEKKFYPCDKDFTDSELALMCAREIEKDAFVTLIGGNGGFVDHFISLYDSFSGEAHASLWLCVNQAVLFLEEGKCAKISGLEASDRVSVARLTSEYSSSVIECTGLEWNILKKNGMGSVSNRISCEYLEKKLPVSFYAKKGSGLIFFPFHCTFKIEN